MSDLLHQLDDDLVRLVSATLPSLVQIRRGGDSLGAGTIWHPNGLVLTNAHVVATRRRSTRSVEVVLADGRAFPAQPIAWDRDRDLAALAIQVDGLPTIEPGDSRSLRPGDWIVAVGHPWGVLGAATAGTVITIGPPAELPLKHDFIQVGLQLRPGHSGGPMVDVSGRLVGINTMINGPLVGLAVPVHEVKLFLKDSLGRDEGSRGQESRIRHL